jgi:hypothetical protein
MQTKLIFCITLPDVTLTSVPIYGKINILCLTPTHDCISVPIFDFAIANEALAIEGTEQW